ncbi:Uu.00g121610.m01.CDS01 [Anthostomella pinea]|uniref:Uu.00g121610.m01.CDS01 n=1 Tax=Anthostomella pinea TaxID=933095 RepID=A0AAI8VH25_9PEZI|nr:Uu.00g121610.m01.CDS01 [Anthostomella pinea]
MSPRLRVRVDPVEIEVWGLADIPPSQFYDIQQLITATQQPNTYFHFPSPEEISGSPSHDGALQEVELAHPPPPKTTHYWTSDHTRRLEYAAIDAASQGVKGWIIKHVLPDCFVPKENRRLRFDDDTGSVRRYRLELDCDEADEKEGRRGKKLGWLHGR